LHLNNARYLSVMDYARMHLLARGGMLNADPQGALGAPRGRGLDHLPAFAAARARYQLATRLVGWDDRWFYMEQTFTGEEGLAAVGWVKGALRDKSGRSPAAGAGPGGIPEL
jgi:acyl-CoA thioesterase FadM